MPKAPQPAPVSVRFSPRLALAAIVLLLGTFAALAFFAVSSKAPTYDEPLHALGAWQHLWLHDFRVNPEDPPLWHYWAALPNGPHAIKADTHSKAFADVAADTNDEWYYVIETLFRTEGNDADTFILRSRVMMLIVGVALGVAIAWWSWQLGGAFAAIVATLFYCLDPNILAHAPLVKNDISLSLVMLGLVWSIWRAGRRLTIWNALAICLMCAAAVNVKFSGVLLGPIAAALLLSRALIAAPWRVMRWTLTARSQRLAAALSLCLAAAVVSWAGTWACYCFRYNPTPDPRVQISMDKLMYYTAMGTIKSSTGRAPTTQEIDHWKPTFTPRAILKLNEWHALPQAWLAGLLYTYQSALYRPTYLLGDHSITGWWYYFPMAMLYKSAMTLLLACAGAAAIGFNALRHRDRASTTASQSRWTIIALALPGALYLLAAMTSNLNLGLRHVLPVYPLIYIALGLAAARLYRRSSVIARRVLAGVVVALGAEALLAFPNYIAFFNLASGGMRNGINLLGDSNLDWGQDLKLLAHWQQDHPRENLYLIYFGSADPWAYGIKYVNFPGGYKFGPVYETRNDPGVLAVSATMLQGIYAEEDYRAIYSTLRKLQPFEVLGGTIYLYHWPPSDLPPG